MSGRTSAKTGRAPRKTNALTVETKVKDGTTTSSPGRMSRSSAAISKACVHEVVSKAFGAPSASSSNAWHFFVNGPSPDKCPEPIAFYDDGDLADGQHRLWAIVDSGMPIEFPIARGLSRADGLNINTGLGRSLAEC